ncbi:LOW QUALITY PROTEIN: uncharacterized protein LOC111080682 [Drosophila obscura]|uniref:LOW QUALITY PROTEIN: uncharacterized protein LOC111080682 n=1 Tax=Drosophila obscura TaxID=7282 RepID=UPI001BB11420|nr:LOW QUALITY PROTEIN: uncharacterized protein LOC111080682 [Drosophila obscura]
MKPPGQHANSSLTIYALMWLLLSITMSGQVEAIDASLHPHPHAAAAAAAAAAAFPFQLPPVVLPLEHGKGNYHDTGADADAAAAESLAGLTGYTRNYYGTSGGSDDLARATYGNYAPPHQLWSSLGSTANGFVPFPAYSAAHYGNKVPLHSAYGEHTEQHSGQQRGNIDFAINTGNYEANVAGPGAGAAAGADAGPGAAYQSYVYQPQPQREPQPRVPLATNTPHGHYHFEQISNYREQREAPAGAEYEQDNGSGVYSGIKGRQTLLNPVKRQQEAAVYRQQQETENQQELSQRLELRERQLELRERQQELRERQRLGSQQDQQDQQLLYSHTDRHIAELPKSGGGFLPPITSSVHHTPASSKALAGLPLGKHIEITRQVPVTHYQKQLVPYKQTLQVQVPRTVIAAVPRPVPIKVPVSKTVAVPQLHEVKIPIERIKPVPVERPIPFVVERRVPYRVEKAVATPVYYPYPVKVPVVRTVVHKQHLQQQHHHPHYVATGGWNANHLLG